ncbi:MtrAB system response regulator MtrA [Candidatus Aquiluna sp. UB-MaderosW2red]|jgi:two-component system response regulator MtrA|uniref:MtrAB system response regulator MtrA n=1 Tax=Candidatus Aquiluna sp. UB-MaderosW2red TaxID=1855377 RepID=UPI000875C5F4|nr:MtrAB system response regulator MtrA [Candidatus Aquiluna sp. UB-MaderosW2red]SCX07860.1 two-component system, OmpR family, response regulator MtrA [Candidatus Aquiluna sp. UB-MaderosW2red]
MSQKILVVDDDDALREMVGLVLSGAGYNPVFAADGISAVDVFSSQNPDLVLLDIMLPGQSGIEVCRQIRSKSGVPIIMLTARGDTEDVVLGLEAGADDYVVKPHNGAELLARVKARLRPLADDAATVQIGSLVLDPQTFEVKRGDTSLSLTPLEFKLLHTLAAKPQQVFSREMLLEQVWGYQYKADTRLVNVHVQRLRSKIEVDAENPKIVMTVRGHGYRAGTEAS